MRVEQLGAEDLGLIARIDRSEHVDIQYAVVDGRLTEAPVVMADVPSWDPVGSGPNSVASKVEFCAPIVAGGAALLGAFEDDDVAGLAIIDPSFEPGLAWLAWLHVGRPYRRRGA